ncbi:hypothetical protein Hanom_Chr10g00872301 [Helianthus anomalus]
MKMARFHTFWVHMQKKQTFGRKSQNFRDENGILLCLSSYTIFVRYQYYGLRSHTHLCDSLCPHLPAANQLFRCVKGKNVNAY